MNQKPGWKTSEFWLSVGVVALIAALSQLDKTIDLAGVPPMVVALEHLAAPLAMAWLSKHYTIARSEVKEANSAATAAGTEAAAKVLTSADAVKVFNGPGPNP